MATTNLLALLALAVHGGRHVVVPFVHNSKFETLNDQEHVRSPTLDLYFNLTAMNNKLRSDGYNDLASFASVNSSGAHPPPGQPRGICSNVCPGGGALAILSQPGGWALVYPGARFIMKKIWRLSSRFYIPVSF